MLLENPSTYVAFEQSRMSEVDFLSEIVERTGCGTPSTSITSSSPRSIMPTTRLLIWTGFRVEYGRDPSSLFRRGYRRGRNALVDRRARNARRGDRLKLYEHALERTGPVPTLIEWDNDVPPFEALMEEAK